jgi:hypothetical protein
MLTRIGERLLGLMVPAVTAKAACSIAHRIENCWCDQGPLLQYRYVRNCERLNDCRWYCDPCYLYSNQCP